jgi:hypothetical protein
VPEDFDEGVLNSFVSFEGVSQVLIGDTRGAALVEGDQVGKARAGVVHLAVLDKLANLDRQARILGWRRNTGPQPGMGDIRPSRSGLLSPATVRSGRLRRRSVARNPQVCTHKGIRWRPNGVYSVPEVARISTTNCPAC